MIATKSVGLACCAVVLALGTADAEVIVTGRVLDFNGRTAIPHGLFGVHAAELSDERVADWGIESVREIAYQPTGKPVRIEGAKVVADDKGRSRREGVPLGIRSFVECYYDRYQPALCLTRADWRAFLADLGRRYGEAARRSDQQHYLEFWNEPYLNWAMPPAVNYHGIYYRDADRAVAGAPMRLLTTGELVPGLVWDRRYFVAYNRGRQPDYYCSSRIPPDGQPGQTVKLRGAPGSIPLVTGTNVNIFGDRWLKHEWFGRDVAQKHYWSGPVNRRFYIEQYLAFAQALKAANPEVPVAAGWGFNLFNEGWDVWRDLYRPTLDAVAPWTDALHEHHYGGDTRLVAVSYEMAFAYALARHGRRLTFWNTETAGYLDPEQPAGRVNLDNVAPLDKARQALTYMLRDVIYLLARCPDKALFRAAHAPGAGEAAAFRLLKPLRGRLMETRGDDPDIWSVGAWSNQVLTVALFNEAAGPRAFTLRVTAPDGARWTGAARHDPSLAPPPDGRRQPVAGVATQRFAVAGLRADLDVRLAPRAACVYVFRAEGAPRFACLRATQHIASALALEPLVALTPDAPRVLRIEAPRLPAERMVLRLALDGPRARLQATIGGQTYACATNGAGIYDLPLAAPLPPGAHELVLKQDAGGATRLAAVSLLVYSPE